MTPFEKKKLVLRQLLIGAGYFEALAAMEFAERFHTGFRKDGHTPEFQHQVEIALFALTLPNLMFREEVIATIFLHDIQEDYDVSREELVSIFRHKEFAARVVGPVWIMTKKFRGMLKDEGEVFEALAGNAIASIAKGCDRIHNLQTMVGVFSIEKQKKYIEEVKTLFLPMLKAARRRFPHQVLAYENIKFVLNSQVQLIEASISASEGNH